MTDPFKKKLRLPTGKELQERLGKGKKHWEELKRFAEKKIGVKGDWHWYGPQGGWAMRFLAERGSLFSAYPMDPGVAVWMTIGKTIESEVKRAVPKVATFLRKAYKNKAGSWIEIPILSAADLKLAQKILEVKARFWHPKSRKGNV